MTQPVDESERTIELFFDFISPNAYLAWTQIGEFAARYGYAVEPMPVLFPALLDAGERRGPAETPLMWDWMIGNVLRKAALLGVSIAPPSSHPFNPLLSLRVASLPLDGSTRHRVIDDLFRAAWAEGLDVSDEKVVAAVVGAAGIDGTQAVEQASSPEIKMRLREQTDAAHARGVFGVPTMIARKELFWGYDDFPQLERLLAGDDPLPREEVELWKALRPSAWRRGRTDGPAGP